jgi:ADP-ribosyl-[dinitrogen reductase] hydrolase
MPRTAATSASNPLRIAEVVAGPDGGVIGITLAPGKYQPDALSGSHRRDLAADLDVIAAWNAAAVVTLTEMHELVALRITELGSEVRRRHMEWHHLPIRDHDIPDAAGNAEWPALSAGLRGLLSRGCRVLVHCKGGLGRAGSVAARLLVEMGWEVSSAIAAVRAAREGAIQAEVQERWIAAGRVTPTAEPLRDRGAARDRAIGALVGLAVGDALGAAIEFTPKPRLAPLSDMVAGGPHRLRRGQWTDDTAMALALADSLLSKPDLDGQDLMGRFLDWWRNGTYSCTGTCFDIGIATSEALAAFEKSGGYYNGSTDPSRSGNGALMRFAPVAIRHWRDRSRLDRVAELQTRTTHGSPATLDASHRFATILAEAIAGASLTEVLASPAAAGIEGGWRGLHRDAVQGSGYVVRSLQAAVWAVSRTTNFRDAVLLAANLGDDADTTAAVAGQLAGAIYGASAIPAEWLAALAWRERLVEAAGSLFDASWPEAEEPEESAKTLGGPFAGFGMTADWTLRERLAALAAFGPVFEREGFVFADYVPPIRHGDAMIVGHHGLTPDALRFYEIVYAYGWVRSIDYHAWSETAHGAQLLRDGDAIADATEDDLAFLLTVCIRADRFSDGYLAGAYESGLIGRIVARASDLLVLLERRFGSR